ncbi:MAG: glycine/D-amino acid oxidase-like deaminating enzyme [Porticoccaceae bacterium]|mgnify:FL=1|jgi:glycine/D-amino acid oxidase-like deaminating enzyme
MNRRTLLKLLALTPLAASAQEYNYSPQPHILVVGAGLIGASIAYHLSILGAKVTVIDKQGPASHASRGTFAWINASYAKQPQHYHSLSQQSVEAWHQLQQQLNIPVKWGGSLEWFSGEARQQKLIRQIAEQQNWGEPAGIISAAQASSLEPHVDFTGASNIAFSENDGAVDPVLATRILLQASTSMGAQLIYPSELSDTLYDGTRLVAAKTTTGRIMADKIVLATGAATDIVKKIAKIDIPQRSTPGAIVITAPLPPILNRIVAAPGVHVHQRLDGRIVMGEQAGAPKNDAHNKRLATRANHFPSKEIAHQHGQRILDIAIQYVPGLRDAQIEQVHIGWRPLPVDGHPVLGYSTNRASVYLAMMHSGVTLAPIVGRLVAQEIMSGKPIQQLENYRPDRVFDYVKRY